MDVDLRGRDLLREADFTFEELSYLIDLAGQLKAQRRAGVRDPRLVGRVIALIFEKTSTRTRCAFEVAAYLEGAHVTFLDPGSSQLGHKESVADTARVLAGMFDAIQFRGSAHETVERLAAAASVPVYNGLTDTWHPTQMLADFLTMKEHSGAATWPQISYAYVGDARNNMGNSLLTMGAIMGADVRIAAPAALWPAQDVQDLARTRAAASGARILLTEDPREAVRGAAFVHTDVWVSMGEAASVWDARVEQLRPYRVDAALMSATGRESKLMHCLPAFHDTSTAVGAHAAERFGMTDGLEVSDEVFGSSASIVFEQSENRLHTIRALLVATLGG